MNTADKYSNIAQIGGGKQHLDFVDIMRGIGIILVVLGHSIGTMSENVNTAILSFHMPLFFFISGMFISTKYTPVQFIKNKLYSLLIPQLTLGVITIIESIVFDVIFMHRLELSEVNYLPFITSWFLPTLFFMETIIYIVLKLSKERKLILLLTLIITSILFIVVSYNKIQYIQQILAAMIFGFLGFILKPTLIYFSQSKIAGYGSISFFILCLVFIASKFNEPIGMYKNQYGNKVIFILIAIIGITTIYLFSILIKTDRVFTFIGKNSICIYVTHFLVLKLIRGIVNRIDFVGMHADSYPYYFITFLITMLIEIPCIVFICRYIPFIVGKKKLEGNK